MSIITTVNYSIIIAAETLQLSSKEVIKTVSSLKDGLSMADHEYLQHALLSNSDKKQRIVIIGAGPTCLGAAQRLYELGIMRTDLQLIILEQESVPGGLATSQRDDQGFLWDMGDHVVFSHYNYFDQSLDNVVEEWNKHTRAAFAFMAGSDNERKFIPYPVQENINAMSKQDAKRCLKGLEEVIQNPKGIKPANFDEWLLKNFGRELSEVFMRKYNRKVWTVDPVDMNAAWVGERVAVPDVEKIRAKITSGDTAQDTSWGPNRFFRFPRFGGTGGMWKAIASKLPQGWFYFNQSVTGISIKDKKLAIVSGDTQYSLEYDILLNTSPLDTLLSMVSDNDSTSLHMKTLANDFVYSHTHVLGIGLKGQPPQFLNDKSWIYFPDSDSPFYRITLFSKYSDDHVPEPGMFWSLMCEAAEPKDAINPEYWTTESLLNETVRALVNYGYISADQVVSKYHRYLHHGYPVPFLRREKFLGQIQEWLEANSVYSRGRFGGWRYEVSNQDHSFMQGVEIADHLMLGTPESTYPYPNRVNSQVNPDPSSPNTSSVPHYEFVISHYDENLHWLDNYSDHCHVYHKENENVPRYQFRQWDKLPNVGREGHTYLHHIITNYDHLAGVTVFLQGNIHNHQVYKNLTRYVTEAESKGVSCVCNQTLNNWTRIDHVRKFKEALLNNRMLQANLTLGEFWFEIFGYNHPREVLVQYGAVFGVSRQRIHSHPKSFYGKIISYVNTHSNPEYGHYLERFWIAIFTS